MSPYIGVSANITVRYAAVCDTDPSQYNQASQSLGNFTAAWSMISDSAKQAKGWLQSGYLRAYGQSLVHFAEWYNHAYGYYDAFGAVVNPGEVHQYWQQYYPDSQGDFHSNVDTTRFINVTGSQLVYGWSGYSQQFSGETAYLSSDIAGGASYPASFSSLQVQTQPTSWQSIPSPFLKGVDSNPGRWSVQPTSPTSFNIWTQNYG